MCAASRTRLSCALKPRPCHTRQSKAAHHGGLSTSHAHQEVGYAAAQGDREAADGPHGAAHICAEVVLFEKRLLDDHHLRLAMLAMLRVRLAILWWWMRLWCMAVPIAGAMAIAIAVVAGWRRRIWWRRLRISRRRALGHGSWCQPSARCAKFVQTACCCYYLVQIAATGGATDQLQTSTRQ